MFPHLAPREHALAIGNFLADASCSLVYLGRKGPGPALGAFNQPWSEREVIMPFVNIRIVKGVLGGDAQAKKHQISDHITQMLSDAAGVPREAVWVVFEDIPAHEWYVGTKSVEEMQQE